MTPGPTSGAPVESFVAGLARSDSTRPFWDGLAAGELRLPRCLDCGTTFFHPRRWCPRCWSGQLEWRRASGRGHVYAVTTVHVPFDPSVQVPVAIALVDLDEGVRIVAVLDPVDGGFAVGDAVEITFADDPASALPVFRRATGDASP